MLCLPVFAIVSAFALVRIGSVAWELARARAYDAEHPEVRRTERDVNGAFEKILPRSAWVAAGLPAAPAEYCGFAGTRFESTSTRFWSERWFSGPGVQQSRGHLAVDG